MSLEIVARDGLVLLGCGKMGSALLAGWLKAGIAPGAFWVIEPNPTDGLKAAGGHLNRQHGRKNMTGLRYAARVGSLTTAIVRAGLANTWLRTTGNGSRRR